MIGLGAGDEWEAMAELRALQALCSFQKFWLASIVACSSGIGLAEVPERRSGPAFMDPSFQLLLKRQRDFQTWRALIAS